MMSDVLEKGAQRHFGLHLFLGFLQHAFGAQDVGQGVAQHGHVVGLVVHGGVDFLLELVESRHVVLCDELPDFGGVHEATASVSSVTRSFFAVANSSSNLPSLNPAK